MCHLKEIRREPAGLRLGRGLDTVSATHIVDDVIRYVDRRSALIVRSIQTVACSGERRTTQMSETSDEPLGEWLEMIQSLQRVIRSLTKTIAAAEAESWPEEKITALRHELQRTQALLQEAYEIQELEDTWRRS
jgi:hypothetical protein